MPQDLTRENFTAEQWDKVQQFDCGEEPYQREVSDWLKRPLSEDGALTAINNAERPGRVWLYRLRGERLVGFGALGYSEWRWTKKKDPFVPLTVITWCANQKEFQGATSQPTKSGTLL